MDKEKEKLEAILWVAEDQDIYNVKFDEDEQLFKVSYKKEDKQKIKLENSLKPKKGRQGRSKETRLRRRKEKFIQAKLLKTQKIEEFRVCRNCHSEDYILQDDRNSSMICINCGLVIEDVWNTKTMTNMICDSFGSNNGSNPYEREVHYQQRLSSVQGKDPEVEEEDIRKIQNFLELEENRKIRGASLYFCGWQSIKEAVKKLKLNPVYSSRWVQIRSRFYINGIDKEVVTIPDQYTNVLKLRFILVSQAFDKTIFNNNNNNQQQLSRKNMINLNFLIPCLIRLESEELFRDTAKFFPQNKSEHQPEINNQRLEIIINYCRDNFSRLYVFKEEHYNLKWEYKPITTSDIINYFIYFR